MKKPIKDSAAGQENGCCSSIEAHGNGALLRVRRILVPADFSEDSDGALRCAVRLANQCGASINVVYGIVSMNDLKNEAADLIVISTRERNGRSLAEQVVRHAPCPVVVVRRNGTELRLRSNN